MIRTRFLLPGLAGLLLAGCGETGPETHTEQFFAFGTVVEVVLHDVEEQRREELLSSIQDDLEYHHGTWHPWEASSLNRVNQLLPTGEWFSGGPSILPLVRDAAELSRDSGYRFNPAIGKLVALWGFHGEPGADAEPPDDDEIQALVEADPTLDDIETEGIRMRGHNADLRLDFGGYAKGVAVDHAIDTLQDAGVEDAIINAGGDLRVIGQRGADPWRIGIRGSEGQSVIARIGLSGDEALATSGIYERTFEHEGERYHHIIDPETGYPAEGLASVTVLHQETAVADAAATALLIAGPEAWPGVARDMGIRHVMATDEDGTVRITPELHERITFEVTPETVEEVSL